MQNTLHFSCKKSLAACSYQRLVGISLLSTARMMSCHSRCKEFIKKLIEKCYYFDDWQYFTLSFFFKSKYSYIRHFLELQETVFFQLLTS